MTSISDERKEWMKERPIIFNGEMVRAILEGRKTQTRRVIKPQPEYQPYMNKQSLFWKGCGGRSPQEISRYCDYGQPGDRLWVRETWGYPDSMNPGNDAVYISYIADKTSMFVHCKTGEKVSVSGYAKPLKLIPSIFMPRWASRLTLEIVSVRVERLQDISNQDIYAEGLWFHKFIDKPYECKNNGKEYKSISLAFSDIWDSINAKRGYSWESNPWVWVIEFKRVES